MFIAVFVDNYQVRYKDVIPGNSFMERSGTVVFPLSHAEYLYLQLEKGHATEESNFLHRLYFSNNSRTDISELYKRSTFKCLACYIS